VYSVVTPKLIEALLSIENRKNAVSFISVIDYMLVLLQMCAYVVCICALCVAMMAAGSASLSTSGGGNAVDTRREAVSLAAVMSALSMMTLRHRYIPQQTLLSLTAIMMVFYVGHLRRYISIV